MRRITGYLAVLGLGIAICVSQLAAATVAAAQAQPGFPIAVSTSGGTPLVVDGIEPDKLPAGVAAGSTVCAPGPQVYKSEGERFIFQQWSDGSTANCITPSKPGAYRANYAHEVLLVVKSAAPGVQRSMWVSYGVPITLDVPAVVQDREDSRFRFEAWSDGETPFEHANTIAPVKPTALEVKWVREHQVTVEAPDGADIKGSGWYADGSTLVLRAPGMLPGANDQERWKFSAWQSDSFPAAVIPNPQTSLTTLKVDAPYTVRAAYDKQYLVDAESPFGTIKRDWIKDGDQVILDTPPIADISPDQERLVFKRWDGIDGLLSPKITGKVDKPIAVTAVYERQVMLKVNAPHGSAGEGWQQVGSVATISVPSSFSEMFLMNATFSGFGGYPRGQSSIQVLVTEPTTLTALYRTEPNLAVLALLLLLPLLAVIVYLMATRGGFGWLRVRIERVRAKVRATRNPPRPAAATEPLEFIAQFPARNGTHLPLPIGDELK